MENEQQHTSIGGKRPWAAYNIIKREGAKNIWSRVGSAFKNRDGSFNVFLDAYPVGGKIHIREDDREHGGAKDRGQLAGEAEA